MRKHIKYYNFDINTTLYIHQICVFYHLGYGFTTKAILQVIFYATKFYLHY